MVTFGRKKSFLDFYLDYNRVCLKIETAKVRNGQFWTISIKFRVFLMFKGHNEKFFGRHFLH